MKRFSDYLKEKNVKEDLFAPQDSARKQIDDTIAIISNMEPKDLADNKDILIELQRLLERALTGGD